MVYDYPDNAQQVLGHKKRVAQSARAFRYIEVLDPAFVVPSAGPPCFLDDDLFEHNDIHGNEWNTFPDQPTFLDYIEEQGRDGGRLMLPGTRRRHRPGPVRRHAPGRPGHDLRRQARLPRGVPGAQARRSSTTSGPRWQGSRGSTSCRRSRRGGSPLLEQADMICAGINQPVLLDCGDERHRHRLPRRARSAIREPDERPALPVRHPARAGRPPRPRAVDDWVNELFLSMRFTRAPAGPVQRLRLHVVQVPQRGAPPVRGGLLRRARADPGHVRARRLQRPAPLSAHEGRPDAVRARSRTGS